MEKDISLSEFEVTDFKDELPDFSGFTNFEYGLQVVVRYSRKAALKTFNGRLNGAFQNTFSAACSFGSYNGFIQANAVQSIVSVGICSTGGHEIMKITHI